MDNKPSTYTTSSRRRRPKYRIIEKFDVVCATCYEFNKPPTHPKGNKDYAKDAIFPKIIAKHGYDKGIIASQEMWYSIRKDGGVNRVVKSASVYASAVAQVELYVRGIRSTRGRVASPLF